MWSRELHNSTLFSTELYLLFFFKLSTYFLVFFMNLIRIVVKLRFIYWSSKSLKGITMQYSILVGNLGYWYSYGCHLTCATHTNTVADHVHPLWQCRYPTAATVGHSVVQHHKNCSGTRRGLQIPQIPIQLSNCGMYWTTELKGFPPRWCQIQQDTLTGQVWCIVIPPCIRLVLACPTNAWTY